MFYFITCMDWLENFLINNLCLSLLRKRINTYFFCILDGCSVMHTCIPLIFCQNNKTVNKGERKVTFSWQNPSTNGATLWQF